MRNSGEHQPCDDCDQPRKCKSKSVSIWISHFGLCHLVGATVGIDSFFRGSGNTERGSAKLFRQKNDWKRPARVYKWYTRYRYSLLVITM